MTKILLTGKNGQLGWELRRTLVPLGEVVVLNRDEMDLANPDSIRTAIRRIQPDLIVNAAAYTAVDQAESEPQLAMAINGLAPGIMAEEAKRQNAGIIHFSTDYVFDGTADRPYREDDTLNPLNVYGKTKLAGERAIQAAGVPHLILRTSWLYAARGRNFLLTILRLAGERKELKIVDDQIGTPTWSRLLAEITYQIVTQFISPRSRPVVQMAETSGIYHAVSAGSASWYGFAKKILEIAHDHVVREMPKLIPIATSDYPLPAARPRNSCLSNEKITRTFGLAVPSWEESLTLCLNELYGKQVT
ncbi:MAG: dTDP-4-dehydrorhamnose reductase [Gammaproteobacteria bacterium]|nr:dTDP-4-dehydrorhamnose reductase [Gammaproteobacteria bacterium]MDH3370111.1 dTDP-4-dehydrorhamnose reductase [Gammaproteobacteria bacterium]MDH3405453.1 dTDP-4-dehydrorhamnose reductase [Gammaproteobacteria bacterium]MDH3562546.1 dTDP-4-dehydrorhamnose reductase [Gammaproteobacteria bacterium]MDH5486057.1 dTDP-4-dehydrorhamnose reductase [Gammaproteobacteria bacterium]